MKAIPMIRIAVIKPGDIETPSSGFIDNKINTNNKTIGAAITTVIYKSMDVSATFVYFSLERRYSLMRLSDLFSKKSLRLPPELIVIAIPVRSSDSLLLGEFLAALLRAVIISYP